MKSINYKIAEYLSAQRISQAKLGLKIGCRQASLSRLLLSKDMKISFLVKITKALGLPITYFFDGTEHIDMNQITIQEKRIIELEEMLNDKRLIIEQLRNQLTNN